MKNLGWEKQKCFNCGHDKFKVEIHEKIYYIELKCIECKNTKCYNGNNR